MKLLTLLKTTVVTAISMLTAFNTNALVIDLGQTIGSPANPVNEFNRLLEQVELYNVSSDPDLFLPDNDSIITVSTPTGPKSIDLDFTDLNGYLMFKWGNVDHFYYIENEDWVTFNSTVLNKNGKEYLGLSHYNTWVIVNNSLPDYGNMLLMLGVGMMCMATFVGNKN